jgi:hypothetical protein
MIGDLRGKVKWVEEVFLLYSNSNANYAGSNSNPKQYSKYKADY